MNNEGIQIDYIKMIGEREVRIEAQRILIEQLNRRIAELEKMISEREADDVPDK